MKLALLTLMFSATALGAAGDRPKYCDPEEFIIKGPLEPHVNPSDEDVLNPEEAADPAAARRLAATPGPYGHSELGFRYLARMFGYPYRFGTKKDVETWLAREEVAHYQDKKGLWKLWDKWVVNPTKRLSVPRGPYAALPTDGNPDMFFLDERDRLSYVHCVKVSLAAQFCQNADGRNRQLQPQDVVHFAGSQLGAQRYAYCRVYVPKWRQDMEAQATKDYVNGLEAGKNKVNLLVGDSPGSSGAKAAK